MHKIPHESHYTRQYKYLHCQLNMYLLLPQKIYLKMCNKNCLFICIFIAMNGHFGLRNANCEVEISLSLTQIGEFVFAIQQPFFIQIAENKTPSAESSNQNGHLKKKLANELANLGKKYGVTELIKDLENRMSKVAHFIAKKSNEFCENLDEKTCREKEREVNERLIVRELFEMARKLVKYKILRHFFFETGEANTMIKVNLHLWWYRFRNRVDSAVTFENNAKSSEIRLGIVQYYCGVEENFQKIVNKIGQEFAFFEAAINVLFTLPYGVLVRTHTTEEEQQNFDPVNEHELHEDKITALIGRPKDKVPIYVLLERFPIRLKMGAIAEAMGYQHHALKVYDIEFHFGNEDGALICDKMRQRNDPERGIKFIEVGYTKKSQWKVQKIFNELSDFYIENGQFKEGRFSLFKYDLIKNNCIHFVRIFAERLMGGKQLTKMKNWPPNVMKQPKLGDTCKFMTNCLFPQSTAFGSND